MTLLNTALLRQPLGQTIGQQAAPIETLVVLAASSPAAAASVGVSGARLYVDSNHNHQADAAEFTGATTDATGHLKLGAWGIATVFAEGGADLASGGLNNLVLSASAGATAINPITTLVVALIDTQGQSAVAAQTAPKLAFGLPFGVDLLNYDAALQSHADGTADKTADATANATAVAVQRVSAQLGAIASLLDDTVAAMNAIAAGVVLGGALDLSSRAALNAVFATLSLDPRLVDAMVSANAPFQAASSLAAIAAVQASQAAHFRAWSAALELRADLVGALLAPASGITVDASRIQLQYGMGADPLNGQQRASVGYFNGGIDGVNIGAGVVPSSGDATPAQRNTQAGYGVALSAPNGAAILADADLLAAV